MKNTNKQKTPIRTIFLWFLAVIFLFTSFKYIPNELWTFFVSIVWAVGFGYWGLYIKRKSDAAVTLLKAQNAALNVAPKEQKETEILTTRQTENIIKSFSKDYSKDGENVTVNVWVKSNIKPKANVAPNVDHISVCIDEFVAIDFETADSPMNSACSIGLVKVKDNEIVEKISYLIKPPKNAYSSFNTKVHGIKPIDTENSDTFPVVWNKIKHYFKDVVVVAHNATFDMCVLKTTLDYYNIEMPSFKYFCTMQTTSLHNGVSPSVGKKLNSLCEHFNIPLDNHHDALCDSIACAKLAMIYLKDIPNNQIVLKDFKYVDVSAATKSFAFNSVSVKDIAASVELTVENVDIDFLGKTFVFTGDVPGISREQAYKSVFQGGGFVKDNITKATNFLVVGENEGKGKINKAIEYIDKGQTINIITADEFIGMLNN